MRWQSLLTLPSRVIILVGILASILGVVSFITGVSTLSQVLPADWTRRGSVAIQKPSPAELASIANIWNMFPHSDLTAPGTQTYRISVKADQTLRWGAVWCGPDRATLATMLQPLSMNLLIDGQHIGEDKVLQLDETSNVGQECHRWATVLSSWKSGSVVELELNYTLSRDIFDGSSSYPAGNYRQVIVVTVN